MYFEVSLEQIRSVKRPVAAGELAEQFLRPLPLALLAPLGQLGSHAAGAGEVGVAVRHGARRQQPLVEAVVVMARVGGHDVIQGEGHCVASVVPGEDICREE